MDLFLGTCSCKIVALFIPLYFTVSFTHVKVVRADHLLSRKAAFWNRLAFFIPIQPQSSQFYRCFVSPSIVYLESIMISSGQKCCTPLITTIIAATLSTWFDCIFSGTLSAWFLGSSRPNHMPAPHLALAFPLWEHALSVYTFISSCLSLVPMSINLCTCLAADFSRSVNIWKHSLILFLLVRVGSKIIDPPSSSAFLFCSFLQWVRDSPLFLRLPCSRFSFGIIRWILFSASIVHSCILFCDPLYMHYTCRSCLSCVVGWGGVLLVVLIILLGPQWFVHYVCWSGISQSWSSLVCSLPQSGTRLASYPLVLLMAILL